jgi:hypothetical protein
LHEKPSPDDIKVLKEEALGQSDFDPLKTRKTYWDLMVSGQADLHCKSCMYAKVLYIVPKGKHIEPPWDLWGRLFQWLGPSPKGKWRCFWFPVDIPRRLPPVGQAVGPEHVNGGYSYACTPDRIVIYRKEEATRVLAHEMLHSACLDRTDAILPLREAEIETWAELYLVAVCSEGSLVKANHLWEEQSQWMSNLNALLRRSYGVKTPNDYAWRYTVGREVILPSLKIELPTAQPHRTKSCRLTSPALCL